MIQPEIRILVFLSRGHLPVLGLRQPSQRLCPREVWGLQPRVPSGILLQAAAFLSLLSSEAGGGDRGAVMRTRHQKGAPPAFCLQHPEDPAPLLPLRQEASCRSESLRVGIPEDLPTRGHPRKGSPPRCRHRCPNLRRFSRLQPPLPYSGLRRMFLRQRHVPGGPTPGTEETGGYLPA